MNHTHAPQCRVAAARFGLGLAAALLVLGVLAILSIGAVLLLAGLVVGLASLLALGSDRVGAAAPGRSVMRGAGAVLVVVGLMNIQRGLGLVLFPIGVALLVASWRSPLR